MSSLECVVKREWEGDRVVLRLSGTFERSHAWGLRDSLEREPAPEILLDFTHVRDCSDLAVAVLAHGLQSAGRRVLFRGMRQHQLRILRYCGIEVGGASEREGAAVGEPPSPEPRSDSTHARRA